MLDNGFLGHPLQFSDKAREEFCFFFILSKAEHFLEMPQKNSGFGKMINKILKNFNFFQNQFDSNKKK